MVGDRLLDRGASRLADQEPSSGRRDPTAVPSPRQTVFSAASSGPRPDPRHLDATADRSRVLEVVVGIEADVGVVRESLRMPPSAETGGC